MRHPVNACHPPPARPRALALACALLLSGAAWGQPRLPEGMVFSLTLQDPLPAQPGQSLPVYVSGQRMDGEADKRVTVQGEAMLRRHDVVLRAQRIDYDMTQERVDLQGNVKATVKGDRFTGPSMSFDVNNDTGRMDTPAFTLLGGGAGNAQQWTMLSSSTSQATKVRYSTCPRPPTGAWKPDWWLSASSVNFDRDNNSGFAVAPVVWFKGLPILAAPAMAFVLNDERKTGFLAPSINLDEASGFELTTPYYLNLAPSYDLTLYPTLMSKRGLDLGAEARYLQPRQSGRLRASYMANDKLRANTDRWALSWQHEQTLPLGAASGRLRFDVNQASDGLYWQDFPRGQVGITERLLHNDVAWFGGANHWQASAGIYTWQTLQDPSLANIVAPYDRVPNLTWHSAQPFGNQGPVQWGLSTDLTRFVRATSIANTTNGWRWVGKLRAERQWNAPGAYIRPALALQARHYSLDQALPAGSTRHAGARSATLLVPTASADAGLVLERQTQSGTWLQTLEPRVMLAYTPFVDQTGLPKFDTSAQDFNFSSIYSPYLFNGEDRVADMQTLTAGVTSRWYDNANGREVFSAGVAQRYRLASQRVRLDDNPAPLDKKVSDTLLGGAWNLDQRWTADALMQFDADTNDLTRSTIRGRYHPRPYHTLSVAYRSNRPTDGGQTSELLDLGWQWPLNDASPGGPSPESLRVYGVGRINYSVPDKQVVDALAGLEFDAGCWIARVLLEQRQNTSVQSNWRVLFQLELTGFARVGSNPLRLLGEQIPGYQVLAPERVTPSRWKTYD